jgi:hypothetical protein
MTRDGSPTHEPPVAWLDAIAASEADLAAGRLIDSAALMRRLQADFPAADTSPKPHRASRKP